MLFDAVRRFIVLTGQVGVKGSAPRVKELMTTLRRSGFSSSQISELSGGKWSDTLVRQYTKNWGGVDEVLNLQSKSLMDTLRELASSGRDVGDVEFVLGLDASVRSKGSSLEEVAELNLNLGKLDLQQGEVGKLVTLSRELFEQVLTPSTVKGWMTLDQELVAEGFPKRARWYLHEACEKYGGVTKTLQAFNEFNDLLGIQRERLRLESEVERLVSEAERLSGDKERLEVEIDQRRAMVEAAKIATSNGFDPASLTMISISAGNLGGPYKVASAIRKYGSLEEMDEELAARKAESEKVKMDISDKRLVLRALNTTLEEAKQEYDRNSDVRLVVELLANPRGVNMDRSEVAGLLTRVLEFCAQRIEENREPLLPPSPAWDASYESIKALAARLRPFSDVEAEGS